MTKRKSASRKAWVDPDDAPELTEEWFESADLYHGDKLIRPGRPRSDSPKQATSIRLDPDVLDHFRATGPRWQSRINQALRKAAGLGKRAATR
ncbi:MAG: BrnA antitoxin family protein [Rhodospirillaceae bacterium]|nr:BrnA antitoxin family protein [Rhodospirillaceae bacterium]